MQSHGEGGRVGRQGKRGETEGRKDEMEGIGFGGGRKEGRKPGGEQ